jgi:hypothetical protein
MKKMLVLAVLLSSAQAWAFSNRFRTAPVAKAAEVVSTVAEVAKPAPQAVNLAAKAWAQIVRPFKYVGAQVSSAASYTASKVANGATSTKNAVVSAASSVATSVKTHADKVVVVVKNNPKKSAAISASVVAVSGIAILYNTNEAFRNKVRSLLGLDTEKQVA